MTHTEFVTTLQEYAAFKYENGVHGFTNKSGKIVRDYGAVNDLYEILIRLFFVGDYRLVRDTMLHVKKQGRTDIVVNKSVRYEIGFNGKTWNEGTENNPLEGRYDGVIYGMIDTDIRDSIFQYIADGNIKHAIELLVSYTYIWTNKEGALSDLNSVPARGKFFTIKNNKVMNQYNPGLYKRFLSADMIYGTLLIDSKKELNY